MTPLDAVAPFIHSPVPAAIYSPFAMLPSLQHRTPALNNGDLFDVSGWSSWKLVGDINAQNLTITLAFGEQITGPNPTNQLLLEHTIRLPEANTTGFVILGKVRGPLMSVNIAGQVLDNLGLLELYVSNRTRLYDAPYTPAPLGTILANTLTGAVTTLASVTNDVPFYLGPAKLAAMTISGTGAVIDAGAIARVHDNGLGPNEITLATVNNGQPTTDLWIPNVASSATKWRISADNFTTKTVTYAVSLTAA